MKKLLLTLLVAFGVGIVTQHAAEAYSGYSRTASYPNHVTVHITVSTADKDAVGGCVSATGFQLRMYNVDTGPFVNPHVITAVVPFSDSDTVFTFDAPNGTYNKLNVHCGTVATQVEITNMGDVDTSTFIIPVTQTDNELIATAAGTLVSTVKDNAVASLTASDVIVAIVIIFTVVFILVLFFPKVLGKIDKSSPFGP